MSVDVRVVRSHPALIGALALAVLSAGWLAAQLPHVIVHPAIGWIPAPARMSSSSPAGSGGPWISTPSPGPGRP